MGNVDCGMAPRPIGGVGDREMRNAEWGMRNRAEEDEERGR